MILDNPIQSVFIIIKINHIIRAIIRDMLLKLFLQAISVQILINLWLLSNSQAANVIKSLPGYPGDLPFHLETGYIGVGDEEHVQLFYYYIKSEGDPRSDPLLLWLTGGPGCSAFSGLVLEVGPLTFNNSAMRLASKVPNLQHNPNSWTKVSSIIFLDSPVGTGFSYATTQEAYYSDDLTVSRHMFEFLDKWLVDHGEFQKNPLYISGDSYSGKIIPIIVQEILNDQQRMNLKGYIMGNPATMDVTNSRFEYLHRLSLLSDELYQLVEENCYVNPGGLVCEEKHEVSSKCMDDLYYCQVLEPKCVPSSHTRCRNDDYVLISIWANNIQVQKALHIREGTIGEWVRCNLTIAYTNIVENAFDYHLNFANESLRALVYSGDQDPMIPHIGTLGWIRKLNLPIINEWRPWIVKKQVAGYTMQFSNGQYHLTFATVKGAGHTAPEYKPQECLQMIRKWFLSNAI